MKVYGLTGGVGMGKSTVGQLLSQRGMPVVDTDQLAHQLVEPGQPALTEIQKCFGKEVISPDGTLRPRWCLKLPESKSGGTIHELPWQGQPFGHGGSERFHTECFGRIVAAMENIDSEFLG